MSVVTCHTPECGNAEQPIDLDLAVYDDQNRAVGTVDGVVCGVCGQPITDVTD